ncbi:MAG: PilZ domain-containing protein [Deltaproteobacteria bacterium]|nr:PilZ domain-containing protein [Deltaproteobacteria bacterium]
MDKNPTDESKLVEIISDMAKKLSVRQQHELINYIKFIEKGDEKRGSKRKTVKISVDYSVEDKFYSDILENIGAGGAFIRATRLFQMGHSTSMVVSLPEMEKNIKLKGEIVRLTDEGFGVRFTEEHNEIFANTQNDLWHFQAF